MSAGRVILAPLDDTEVRCHKLRSFRAKPPAMHKSFHVTFVPIGLHSLHIRTQEDVYLNSSSMAHTYLIAVELHRRIACGPWTGR